MGDYVKRCVSAAATVHGNPGVTEILLGNVVTLAHTRLYMRLAIIYRTYVSYIRPDVYLYIGGRYGRRDASPRSRLQKDASAGTDSFMTPMETRISVARAFVS